MTAPKNFPQDSIQPKFVPDKLYSGNTQLTIAQAVRMKISHMTLNISIFVFLRTLENEL
jgi:hypothetical protein